MIASFSCKLNRHLSENSLTIGRNNLSGTHENNHDVHQLNNSITFTFVNVKIQELLLVRTLTNVKTKLFDQEPDSIAFRVLSQFPFVRKKRIYKHVQVSKTMTGRSCSLYNT